MVRSPSLRVPGRKSVALSAAGFLLAVGACRFLLPERYAVNVPLRSALFGWGADPPAEAVLEKRLHVPPGWSLDVFARDLPNARFLRFTPRGDLLVSTPRAGRIVLLLRDSPRATRASGRRTLLEGLDLPQGMDFHDGWLYVAETNAVGRIRYDAEARATRGDYERVITGIPGGGNHPKRTLAFGPDGGLYLSVGSSCNVCLEKDPRRAALLRFEPDGSHGEIYASGLRNSEGFDWRPGTGELYAADNGRDFLGDDLPPEELDRIVKGGFYGWPFAYGDRVPDPQYGGGHAAEIAASIPPAHTFPAHNAPLGMTFLRGDSMPPTYRGAALVALHGSWNRSVKDGYKVVSVHWRADDTIVHRDFLTGFLRDGDVIGRPVDVAEGPDGAVYVSDDYAGAVYRVAPPAAAPAGGPASARVRSP